jgi:hypothetical protein
VRTFLVLATIVTLLLIAAALGLQVESVDPLMAERLSGARKVIETVGNEGWAFGRPLIQLIVILLIIEWFLSKIGVELRLREVAGRWDIQTFLAGAVVLTFCIVVLAGNGDSAGYIRDVVLVVIGFYFGTQSREPPAASSSGHLEHFWFKY